MIARIKFDKFRTRDVGCEHPALVDRNHLIVARMQNQRRHTHLPQIIANIQQGTRPKELDDDLPGQRIDSPFLLPSKGSLPH
jgi:hypothetical protein